jgi:hypothetical protein
VVTKEQLEIAIVTMGTEIEELKLRLRTYERALSDVKDELESHVNTVGMHSPEY